MLDLTHTRICPACLREDVSDSSNSMAMHGRLPWMLLSVRTCPHHGLAIILLPLPEQQKSLQDFVGHVGPMKRQIARAVQLAKILPQNRPIKFILDIYIKKKF